MRDGAGGRINKAAATTNMCFGWCRWQTKPDPALARTHRVKPEVTPGEVSWEDSPIALKLGLEENDKIYAPTLEYIYSDLVSPVTDACAEGVCPDVLGDMAASTSRPTEDVECHVRGWKVEHAGQLS